MCLGVPAKITEITKDGAIVDVGGVEREVSLALLTGVRVGDYVIVHAGFAIQRLDEERALEAIRLFEEFADKGR